MEISIKINSPLTSKENPQIIEKIIKFLFDLILVIKKKYLRKSKDKKIWSVIDEVCPVANTLRGNKEKIKEFIIEILFENNCWLIL